MKRSKSSSSTRADAAQKRSSPKAVAAPQAAAPQINLAAAAQHAAGFHADRRPDSARILALQSAVGNQAVNRLLAQRTIQPKRAAASVGLNHESEADRLAQSPNQTGLPDRLKTGIESLSGMSMDHVRVHYNATQPAQLNALAYAQGSDIFVAPGEQQHLPHEAWHVVQQAQGRVQPTLQLKGGVPLNDDRRLEREADAMGKASAQATDSRQLAYSAAEQDLSPTRSAAIQRLTQAQITGLPASLRVAVKQVFGPHEANILAAAPNQATLQEWVTQMAVLGQQVTQAKKLVENPGFSAVQTQKDKVALTDAHAARNAKLAEFLAVGVGPQVPMWNLAPPPPPPVALAGPGPGAEESEESEYLPEATTTVLSYNDHGDFQHQKKPVPRSGLVKYVSDNGEFFEHVRTQGQVATYSLDMGVDNKGEDWVLLVDHNANADRNTITHFGPFGASTLAKVI